MSGSDLIAAVRPVLDTLDRLRVRHFIGGSVASSAHGIARASLDVDLVAELEPIHVARLVAALEADYFVDEARVRAAVEAKRSFNLIHLQTMFKVDVFVSRGRPFDDSSFARVRRERLSLEPAGPGIPLASAEDVLLAKLEWYRSGGETSERQWGDVKGLLRVGAGTLDVAYLRHWAALVGVSDLLERANRESEA
jgi:hypothetical protein